MKMVLWLCPLALAAGLTAAVAAPPRSPPAPAAALPPAFDTRIAAVVNDEVISVSDLNSRVRMVALSTNVPDTPEVRGRLNSQVLRSMIDEKLQMQEAKRQNVSASDDELNKAIGQIEKQNNMQPGQLNTFLQGHGIDRGTLVDQVTASIVWAKLVRRLAAQSSPISDEEIDDALKRFEAHKDDPEVRVAEILLAVDTPQQDEEVRAQAARLSDQMRQGTRFSAIAQQFSQSATAAVGGDLGWMRPDQLAPELAKAVEQLKPGELSAPIRAGAGYYLLLVLDRRNSRSGGEDDTVLDIVQVVLPLPQPASEEMRRAALGEVTALRNAGKNCPELLRIGKEKAPKLSSEGHLRASEIAPALRTLLMKLPIGEPSQPIVQKNGVGVVMVCSRGSPAKTALTRDDIGETLTRQRIDTLARRYLRDLRRAAFVDLRV